MVICWERAVPLAFHLCCFYFSDGLVVRVLFPFGVWGRVWNSIISVPISAFLSSLKNNTKSYKILGVRKYNTSAHLTKGPRQATLVLIAYASSEG